MKTITKKIISLAICAIMVFGTISVCGVIDFKAFAASGSCGTNLTWSYNSVTNELVISGTGAMTDYSSSSSAPWYSYKDEITEVTIEDGVTSIGSYAFYWCTSFTSITIGNSVTSIGDDAFRNCTGLTSITIGNGVTSIGDYAFQNCTGLTSITIPDSVTSIYYGAFDGCTGLTSITIPDSVTSICYWAFCGCTGLTEINVDNNNEKYCSIDGVLFSKDKTEIVCYPVGKTDTSSSIPDSVTSIGWYAFYGCKGLTSITIPNSVTSIGYGAFYDCTSLKNIVIGDKVTEIGSSAFKNTAYYNNEDNWQDGVLYIGNCLIKAKDTISGAYKIKDGTKVIANYAFEDCTGLTSITIPNSVTSIGDYAFWNRTGLTSITIPNSVTSIGDWAFEDCTGLTSITIGNSVTSIGDDAFQNCTGLKTVYYTGTPTQWSKISIGSNNSYLTSATRICECNSSRAYHYGSYGDNVTYKFYTDGELVISGTGAMTSAAFEDAPWYSYKNKITKVTIENGVTSIGSYAFYYCTSLKSATISDSVTSIGKHAFYGCTGLTSITIGNSVTSIGDWAFDGCTSLVNITIPDSVTCVYYDTFEDTAYYNDETKWENGKVLYIGNHLIKAKDTLSGNYEIKKGTKDISDYAFYGCTSLTEITIPDSVVTIGYQAFCGCSCLLSVSLGNGVKTIGGYAFDDCKSLKDVNLGNNITTIGGGAFNECTNIKSITIPDSVTSIGGGAFYKTGLTSVKIPRTVTSIGEGAFGSTSDFFGYIYDRDFTIYCEKGSEAHRYAAANDLNCVLVNDASTGNNSSNGSNSGGSSLSFFQRIIAFFKGIFQSIKNLFS